MTEPRLAPVAEIYRYDRAYSPIEVIIDGFPNYWFIQEAPGLGHKRMMLESGINSVAEITAIDGLRRPAIALRSSPWKAGGETTPWHDEFDLAHGHVRYFGDHKASTLGPIGSTRGNRELLNMWELHASGDRRDRLKAAPILMFRAVPVYREGRRIDKGQVEFCGVGIIERLEYVLQRDPKDRRSFPNIVIDLDMISLGELDAMDFRWIDDRRNPDLSSEATLRHAPASWVRWVNQGKVALPRIRRRVMSSRVLSKQDQLPEPGSREESILWQIYHAFDDNKHAFEWLASRVAEQVLGADGARYREGWLTRAGGDGGMDFVGRLDVGNTEAKTPLVVLGQAKCVLPDSSISPDQVARVVARLRRGWIGVFVTTGHFSQQAQVEVVDDEYPVVLVPGKVLAETVFRLAEESYEGDIQRLLAAATDGYRGAVTHRRPEEILTG